MNILIIYDTFFGNTQKVAEGIRDCLEAESHDVLMKSVKDTVNPELNAIDLLIIGSPTRAFKPTKEIVAFIKSIDGNTAKKLNFALFDTRMNIAKVNNKLLTFMVKLFGFADSTMEKLIKRKGGTLVSEAKGFFVEDSEGPLSSEVANQPEDYVHQLLKSLQ